MGRLVKKQRGIVSPEQYEELKGIILEARSEWNNGYDMSYFPDEGEDRTELRKQLEFIAKKEDIEVRFSSKRDGSIGMIFGEVQRQNLKVPYESSERKILAALSEEEPRAKKEILEETGVAPSTWNVCSRKLRKQHKIMKIGTGAKAKYVLA